MELMPGVIPAPALQQRTKASLLSSAAPGSTPGGVDWRKGIATWPESTPYYRLVQDCTDEAVEYGDETDSAPIGARPFVIQSVVHCPRASISAMAERARTHLRAMTSTALAYELWTGEATALDPWKLPTGQVALGNQRPDAGTDAEGPYLNPHFDSGTAPTMTANSFVEAIGLVEAEVMDRYAGGPVYLHVPASAVLELLTLESQGDLIRTPLGSIVVADAGYPPNTGAGSNDLTVYGTGPVSYWLDDPVVYDQDSWVVDHANNRVAVWAERTALLLFDPQTLVGCTVTG